MQARVHPGVAIACAVAGTVWGLFAGGAMIDESLVRDCETLGAFRTNGVVYECHRKPAAQGVVK